MSNLNSLFLKHNDNITLSSAKKDNLVTGRNAIRTKIKDDFKENSHGTAKFHMQGSFAMKTCTNPITGDEYDVDDGVYLEEFKDTDQSTWPAASTVHNWIIKAIEDHTDASPINKETCVRVVYANNYHIDLPAYIIKDDIIYLAKKKDGWKESDPKAFTKWFVGKVQENDEQLRRIVKYLKGWRDSKDVDIKSIVITILVTENYYKNTDRDDKALLGTVTNIIDTLENDFKCVKPVIPNEDLLENYGDSDQEKLIQAFIDLQDALEDAINKDDEEEASLILIDAFDERFPKGEKKKENSSYVQTPKPAVLKNDGNRSA
jgi:hypothetical protein